MPSFRVEKALFDVARFQASADTAPLAALHAASFPDAWDARAIRTILNMTGAYAFHHADGFVLARAAAGESEILTLAVAPAARGKGLGRALLSAAIQQAKADGAEMMFLEVGADNPAALALYSSMGFVKVGMRKAYYDGRDAQVLRLPLSGELA